MNLEYCALDALFVQRIKVKFNVEDIEDVKKKKKVSNITGFPSIYHATAGFNCKQTQN